MTDKRPQTESAPEASADDDLRDHRDRIDRIDLDILALMNQRIEAAKAIGQIKSSLAQPAYYRPEREARVLARLVDENTGPMTSDAVTCLFREIMSLTRGSEAGLSVSILGPLGTFSEAAARQHFGSTMQIEPCDTVSDAFRAAETGRTDFCVVPVENSNEGGVGSTLDRLVTTGLEVCGEINFKVHHNLLSNCEAIADIKQVTAHPQALAQCRVWLDKNLPNATRMPANSNAEAAVVAASESHVAAIAGMSAAERYKLSVLAQDIEDSADNTTRFLVLSDRKTPPTRNDKTSLLLSAKNRPGALLHLLQPLLENKIDMTRLESRPSKTGLWEYVFFIDIEGHQLDERIKTALDKLRDEAGLFKLLGSYPRSR
ncbi:MAG: prephenate dehydratase [Pseudomonadota bacterium]